MVRPLRTAALLVASIGAAALCGPTFGQSGEGAPPAAVSEPPGPADIIVEGRRMRELRHRIEIAEDAIHARFNDINSTDDFDIHCRDEQSTGTHFKFRVCPSNSWREQDAKIAEVVMRYLRGQGGDYSFVYRAEQRRMQQLLNAEMRRLAHEDAALTQALSEWADAQRALAERKGRELDFTMSRPVAAGDDGLPYGALRKVEVHIGDQEWSHKLEYRTFTIAHVTGDIRGLALDCLEGDERLDFQPNVDWTVPGDRSSCILLVNATRDTTFALYEFAGEPTAAN